jgi:hypothetical protein
VGGKVGGKGGDYTDEERRVLAATTTVNSREYLPFIAADLRFLKNSEHPRINRKYPNNFV